MSITTITWVAYRLIELTRSDSMNEKPYDECMAVCLLATTPFTSSAKAYRKQKIARELRRAGYAVDEFWGSMNQLRRFMK